MMLHFVIAGAQKSGTTALWHFLRQHPAIGLPDDKELDYFTDDSLDWRNPPPDRIEAALGQRRDRPALGEATPLSLYWPSAMERIAAHNPRMKLIVCLRDPVERAYSHWRMEVARGVETLPFAEAIRGGRARVVEGDGLPGFHREFSYVERGFYAAQLRRLLGWFPRRNLLVIPQPDLARRHAAVLGRVYDFLGVPPPPALPAAVFVRPPIPTIGPAEPIAEADAECLRAIYADDMDDLAVLTGLRFPVLGGARPGDPPGAESHGGPRPTAIVRFSRLPLRRAPRSAPTRSARAGYAGTAKGERAAGMTPESPSVLRVAVTGAAGLVGQNLVPRLKARGFTDIVAIDKHPANTATLRRLHPDITVIETDLARDDGWQERVAAADVVVLLHAQIGGLEAEAFRANNVTATERLLAAIAEPAPYVVHVSSSVVNSAAEDWYMETKEAQETLVVGSGLPCVVLRPTLMFGWFDRKHLGWLARFMRRVPVFPIPGNGRYLRQPLYAGDFCDVLMACIERRPSGAFNISGRERIHYIDLIRAVKQASGAKAAIMPIPYRLFWALLWVYARFDDDPPFTTRQLEALVTPDLFEVIDWPGLFGVTATPLAAALEETFRHPVYSDVVLEF